MSVQQLSVFLENKAGRLAEVTKLLAEANIHICALSLADTSDFGILRLIVNEQACARHILERSGFTLGTTNVIAIEIKEPLNGLNSVLQLMADHSINIEYMYGAAQGKRLGAVMIFRFDKSELAKELLRDEGIPLLSISDLYT